MQNLILAAQQSEGGNGNTIFVTTFTGILIVFAALVLLIFIIWLFGKFFSISNKSAKKSEKKAETVKTAPAAVPVVLPAAPAQSNDDIIAVIAAAVAMYGESEGKTYAVRSVRRSANNNGTRSAWAAAGIAQNVRSF